MSTATQKLPTFGPKPVHPLTEIQIFSATKASDRAALHADVNFYLSTIRHTHEVKEIRTLLSSDNQFHCLAIIVITHKIDG